MYCFVFTALAIDIIFTQHKILLSKSDIESIYFPIKFKSNGNAFVSGAGDLGFKSRAGRIGHSVANGLPPLQHFFETS